MDEVIVVENYVDAQCIRHVHLMSNSRDALLFAQREGGGEIKQGTGVHYYRAKYHYRGILDFHCEGWVKFRRLVVWSLEGSAFVRDGICQAEAEFERIFRFKPKFVFMRKLPRGAEHCQDAGQMILLEAEWMLERCVAVGGRRFDCVREENAHSAQREEIYK